MSPARPTAARRSTRAGRDDCPGGGGDAQCPRGTCAPHDRCGARAADGVTVRHRARALRRGDVRLQLPPPASRPCGRKASLRRLHDTRGAAGFTQSQAEPRGAAAGRQSRAHDEPLGRRADIAEWVARHQRERRLRRGVEHPHVVGLDDLRPLDDVGEGAFRRDEPDDVADLDVLQAAEERVAMTGEPDVARGRPAAPCRGCARPPVAACARPRLP